MTKQTSRGPETDRPCLLEKRPKDRMRLPTGGQVRNDHIYALPPRHSEKAGNIKLALN